MNNDNNLLLIIIIVVVLFWIFNLNSSEKFQNNNYINKNFNNEHFNDFTQRTSDSKIYSESDTNLINKLYTKESFNKDNSINKNPATPKNNEILFNKPPNQNLSLENRSIMYNEIAKPSNVQPIYEMDNATNKTYQSFNDDSYMLLQSNAPKDPKFDKVMPTETRKTLTTSDLLPKDENKDWFQVPNSKFNLMQAVDLEVPEIKIGTDTVGQSLKNATYDLRSAPPNPKFVVSPWQNSTIEPDYNTKPLC
jgi:hypothetical protein